MTQQEQQTSLPSATRLRRSDVMLQILRRDKTPVAILLMAAVVGTLAGLIGVAFEKALIGCNSSDWVDWPMSLITGLLFGRWPLLAPRC